MRQKMNDYINNMTNETKNNSSNYWKFLKTFCKTKKSKSSAKIFKIISKDTSHDTEESVGEHFNKFFTNFQSRFSTTMEESNEYINKLFNNSRKNNNIMGKTFKFTETSSNEVANIIKDLDSKSSAGYIGIPTKLFKYCSETLSPIISIIINSCLNSMQIPDSWKIAIVTPLYKNKGDLSDSNNYRGISVLPPITKIFEKIISRQITSYFERNEFFINTQHGFRKNHSCETALNVVLERWKQTMDKSEVTLSCFIDFKKAFDYV
jgi:hypothetical protein